MVDLAGSEKVWKTNAAGERLEEAKFINKSLLALGQVIYKCVRKPCATLPPCPRAAPAHARLPRDSCLTALLLGL